MGGTWTGTYSLSDRDRFHAQHAKFWEGLIKQSEGRENGENIGHSGYRERTMTDATQKRERGRAKK